MAGKNSVDFEVNRENERFLAGIRRTLVEQPDFTGIGGHGEEDSSPHGLHRQISIGIGNTTVNFRQPVSSRGAPVTSRGAPLQ